MSREKRKTAYLVYRLSWADGKLFQVDNGSGERQRASWEEWDLRPDGWAVCGEDRRRWMVACPATNGDPLSPLVRRDKLDDIRALEALRWRAMQHAQAHHGRKYVAAERRCFELGNGAARFTVSADDGKQYIYKVVWDHQTHRHPPIKASWFTHYEPVREPKDATIVDQLAQIPTPDTPEWKAGRAWEHAHQCSTDAHFRAGRAELALQHALRLYVTEHFPKIAQRSAYSGSRQDVPTVRFTINGRHYDLCNEAETGNRWPRLDDIIVDLDAQPQPEGTLNAERRSRGESAGRSP